MEQITESHAKSETSAWAERWDRGWMLVMWGGLLVVSFAIGARLEWEITRHGWSWLAAQIPLIWLTGSSTCFEVWRGERRGNVQRELARSVISGVLFGLFITFQALAWMGSR